MHLDCPHCGQGLEYSGKRPSFCAYCGKPLDRLHLTSTGDYAAERPTLLREPGDGAAGPEPEAVGGYRLVRSLGAGGMGTVYEAEEASSGRRVALKLIAAEYAGSADAVERFRREGRLASGIAHPRCVFVLAADEEAGRPYIVMELMPGATLRDLVARQGPLPPGDAVAKILDIIDGLREAHRLGVVHRDVKPSNCFLDAEGRVKVGDFGLSKSLLADGHLTRTGAFVGTPLFASPEQVRGEHVDPQSDLYSVAATLYFLLSGRAPFESRDAAVTLARIGADPVPPLRSQRPELSQALEAVVLRGLERDRTRRWRDLDEFRAALLPFLPGTQLAARPGVRFGAFVLDYILLMPLGFAVGLLLYRLTGEELMDQEASFKLGPWQTLCSVLVWVLYFGLPESVAGWSLGKWLLGLRLRTATGSDKPTAGWVLLRVLVFYVLQHMGLFVFVPIMWIRAREPTRAEFLLVPLLALSYYPLWALGIGLVLCTMRARNGYRCLHDFLTGTRVVRLPARPRRRAVRTGAFEHTPVPVPVGLPERVGAFAVRGALRWEPDLQVLLGNDPALERSVVIWLRPQTEPPLEPGRREVTRTTRLRWLAGGQYENRQWDAFLAPAGPALPDLVRGADKLPWSEVRPILEQVAEELSAAIREGTLPASLRVDQVRVQADGPVQLLDWPLTREHEDGAEREADAPPAQRALALLGRVAVLALEGRPLRADDARHPRHPVRAPVPEHASRLLSRLLGFAEPFPDVSAFETELAATHERPDEVTRARRAGHLALSAALLTLGLGCCILPGGWLTDFLPVLALDTEVESDRQALDELERGAWRDFTVSALNPDPGDRLRGLVQLDEDLRLRDQLRTGLERAEQERQARQAALGWFSNQALHMIEAQREVEIQRRQTGAAGRGPRAAWAGDPPARKWRAGDNPPHFRQEAESLIAHANSGREAGEFFALQYTRGLVFWPLAWVLWAFLWRGGLSFRWLDLALIRSDGRRAARWQCALRALLVWGPVVVLWMVGLWLPVWYWRAWPTADATPWMLALSSWLWWAGAALLAAYAALAVVFPRRSPVDWLAGTYLVPR
jgi:uncharacterized RDD family membrane protein YckC